MKVLLLNQCFYPDVVATAQYLTDLAVELSQRGHSVTVVTSDRGYDDPDLRFKRREKWNGVSIFRIPTLSLGKERRWKRVANFASFHLMCALWLLVPRRFDVVVALTSPPLISFLAALFARASGGRLCCWIMDLNPDEAIAAGWLRGNSMIAKLLDRMMNYSLRCAENVVVLDRFMKDRLRDRVTESRRILVLAPWAQSSVVSYSTTGRKSFRQACGLEKKFVVMYSGNHSPCHPLETLLDAALVLRDRCDIAFCFVGGGSEHSRVQEFSKKHRLPNIKLLSYQPLAGLSSSLSAADLHVVIVGNPFVGISHPSKVYNILALGSRILYIGPEESHVTDLRRFMTPDQLLSARHGEARVVAQHILNSAGRAHHESQLSLSASQENSAENYLSTYSKEVLLPELCRVIETDNSSRRSVPTLAAESVFGITEKPR